MGGHGAAVQHTGRGQRVRAGTDRQHVRTALDGIGDAREDGVRRRLGHRRRGHGDEVGVGCRGERARRRDGGGRTGGQRPAGLLRAGAEVEAGHAVVDAVDAEDLHQHPELEQGHRRLQHHGDRPQHDPSVWRDLVYQGLMCHFLPVSASATIDPCRSKLPHLRFSLPPRPSG
jgi:hypothetical protein